MTGVLEGLRVVEAARGVAGPLAGMLFADFGADVVKATNADDTPGAAVWDRGKRSIQASAAELTRLTRRADVCICDGPPLRAGPETVVLSMPPYADHTPWPSGLECEPMVAAMLGVSMRQGSFDGGPVDAVSPILSVLQGVWGAACAVAALYERERSGLGQTVTVAGVHGAMIGAAGALTFDPAALPARSRVGGPGGSVPFYRTYRCGDGEWLFLAALTPRFSHIAFEVLGVTSMLDDERLEGRGRAAMLLPDNAAWVIETMAGVFATEPRDVWLKRLTEAGCPAGAVLDRDDWLDHPQVAAIGMRADVDDPHRGRVVMPGVPLILADGAGSVRGPAPSPGADAPPAWEARPARTPGPRDAHGPLDGVRVLDLGAIIAGPFGASLLGELGADVIKVEPLTGDSFRGPGFAAYNKGQRGVALDLRHPDGKRAFEALVRTADVVVDNYRPGVLSRLGITWDDLARIDERVVSVSVTGFGDGGPFGDDAGFDPVLQAMSGLMRAQGGDSDPVFFTVPVSDVAASACVALGAALALLRRCSSGRGPRVTTALAATATLLQAGELVRFDGRPPPPTGGRDHPGPSDVDRFHAAADGWVRVRTDPLPDGFGDWIGRTPRDDAVADLVAGGVDAVPARTTAELATDEHLQAYGVLHADPRPDKQGCWTAGRHALFSRTQRTDTLIAPALGEHTVEILLDAGLSRAQIDALLESGAAATPPP